MLCQVHPAPLLSKSFIPPTPFLSAPFIFANSQLHCGHHAFLMPGTVPCCHGNNHFKKQYNKISNNESFSSWYYSQEGRGEPEIKLSFPDTNNYSLVLASRPLASLLLLSTLIFIFILPDDIGQCTDFESRKCKSQSSHCGAVEMNESD